MRKVRKKLLHERALALYKHLEIEKKGIAFKRFFRKYKKDYIKKIISA